MYSNSLLLYKSHVLGFVEYRTPAVYHASPSVLLPLDRLQNWLLRDLGLTPEEALVNFGLAPLNCRRDMAMLGVVFRAVLGKGPAPLRSFFKAAADHTRPTTRSVGRHRYQLQTYRSGEHLEVLKRSLLGACDVFNELPPVVVEASDTVQQCQAKLQALVLTAACSGDEHWPLLLSPTRNSWERGQLRAYGSWGGTAPPQGERPAHCRLRPLTLDRVWPRP